MGTSIQDDVVGSFEPSLRDCIIFSIPTQDYVRS
jgi:hypothetical protein